MSCIAVIPARGGSKGVPRKNVLPLAGTPLISHTIRAATEAVHVDRVIVSTDDLEIAEVASKFGGEVIMRPSELSTDSARSEDALLHVLDVLVDRGEELPDILVFLQCTSPFTTADDIDGTIDALLAENADSATSVVPFHYFLWRRNDIDGGACGINHDHSSRQMRQDRAVEYLETGSVYAMRTAGFRSSKFRFFGRTCLYEIPVEHWLEIDEPSDFRIAEERMRVRLDREKSPGTLPATLKALVMDFDGVLTDDRVFVDATGNESVACSRSDGMGIEMLRVAGLKMMVLSKERNSVVAKRCEKLQIECTHGVDNKLEILSAWLRSEGIALDEVVYVGNDVNDLECMSAVACSAAPADAHPAARQVASIVLKQNGGSGAIRELSELILSSCEIR